MKNKLIKLIKNNLGLLLGVIVPLLALTIIIFYYPNKYLFFIVFIITMVGSCLGGRYDGKNLKIK